MITSDKSYKNLEIKRGYKETDLIGGKDPYSASKGCAELIIQSYIDSILKKIIKFRSPLEERAMLLVVEIGRKID